MKYDATLSYTITIHAVFDTADELICLEGLDPDIVKEINDGDTDEMHDALMSCYDDEENLKQLINEDGCIIESTTIEVKQSLAKVKPTTSAPKARPTD